MKIVVGGDISLRIEKIKNVAKQPKCTKIFTKPKMNLYLH